MTTEDRYNQVINLIEELVDNCYHEPIDNREIVDTVCNSVGLDVRQMNSIFIFLTDMSLLFYVRKRRLMSVYKNIIGGNCESDDAIYISGYSDETSFCRAFKNEFNITVSEAKDSGDGSLYEEPLLWNKISELQTTDSQHRERSISRKKFGIDEISYQKANFAERLQSLYDMSDEQAEHAFQVSEKYDISLEEAFDAYDYILSYCEDDIFLSVKKVELFIYCITQLKISMLDVAMDFIRICNNYDIDIFSENIELIKLFFEGKGTCDDYIRVRACYQKRLNDTPGLSAEQFYNECYYCDDYWKDEEHDYSALDE